MDDPPKLRFRHVLDDNATMSPTQTERYLLGWASATSFYLNDPENAAETTCTLLSIAKCFAFEKDELQYVANVALILLERLYKKAGSKEVSSNMAVALLVVAMQISSDEVVDSVNLKNVKLVNPRIPGLIGRALFQLDWRVFVSTREYNSFRFNVMDLPNARSLAMRNVCFPTSKKTCTLPWKRSTNSIRLVDDIFSLEVKNPHSQRRVNSIVFG